MKPKPTSAPRNGRSMTAHCYHDFRRRAYSQVAGPH
jgi:hypothetical protein